MNLVSHSVDVLKKRSPIILTFVSVVGVVATAIAAAKATPKAMGLIEEEEYNRGRELTKSEMVKVAAPAYIPTIVIGMSTVACIFSTNVLNKRQQTAITGAYALVDSSYRHYRGKLMEIFGMDADKAVKKGIAEDRYEEAMKNEPDYELPENHRLYFDCFSERYFEATEDVVQDAMYQLNRILSVEDKATINDFYRLVGAPTVTGGDNIGWSQGMNFDLYLQSWIDFVFDEAKMEDGMECLIISTLQTPSADYITYTGEPRTY